MGYLNEFLLTFSTLQNTQYFQISYIIQAVVIESRNPHFPKIIFSAPNKTEYFFLNIRLNAFMSNLL